MRSLLSFQIRRFILPLFYLLLILVITLLIRNPSLMRSVNTTPFKALSRTFIGESRQFTQILLNIALFIPMGFFLVPLTKRKIVSILIAFSVSLLVEVIQYITCRGQFDVDDLINNTLGAVIGVILWALLRKFKWNAIVSYTLLVAGIVGCIISIQPSTSVSENYTREFDFHIASTSGSRGNIQIRGECYIYGRNNPHYCLYLDNVKMDTEIQGNHFIASAPTSIGKHEVNVHYFGYPLISTGNYLNIMLNGSITIEYVPEEINIPFIVPDQYVLKAYNSDQITYVFEDSDNSRILWYIGWDITPSTEVIYHIQTNEPEKLPEKRIQYGFDNRGFRVKEKNTNELEPVGGFRVFERKIPDTYNVTAISVGFNTSGTITWAQCFRPQKLYLDQN